MPLTDIIAGWTFGQPKAQPLGMLGAQTPTQPGSAPAASAVPVGILNTQPAQPVQAGAAPAGLLTEQPNGFLEGLGAVADSGMLQDLSYGLLNGKNWGQAATMAGNRTLEMAPERRKEAKAEEAKNQTTEALQNMGQGFGDLVDAVKTGAMTPNDAYTEALRRKQPLEVNGQLVDPLSGAVLGDYRTPDTDGAAGSTEFGLTPIWGQMPDGTFGYGVQGKDGSFRQVDTGEMNPLDPRSLAGERAFGTQIGTAQGQGAAAAPSDISNARTALDLLDQIETNPELPWATGTSAGLGGNKVPGTGRYGFQNLVDQAKSGAFLSAIQQMRGMGALSNAEGQVATAAITRMDTALSADDFRKAMADYRAVIQTAMSRAEGRVGMQPNVNAPGGQQPAPATSTGWEVTGVTE